MQGDFIEAPITFYYSWATPKYKWFPYFWKDYDEVEFPTKTMIDKTRVLRFEEVVSSELAIDPKRTRVFLDEGKDIIINVPYAKAKKIFSHLEHKDNIIGFKK